MFNPFKKILHKDDSDFDDVRSHVLGDRFQESYDDFPPAPPMQAAPPKQNFAPQPQQGFDDFTPKTRDVFGEPFQSAPPAMPGQRDVDRAVEKTNRDYDIMDRLSVIEANLTAIRSQTETINERLKNMETKLGYRRY